MYVPRELDHHEADRLKQEADFFIETGQVKTLVFDLRERSSWTAPESGDYRAEPEDGIFWR